jgi:hypothetical protein
VDRAECERLLNTARWTRNHKEIKLAKEARRAEEAKQLTGGNGAEDHGVAAAKEMQKSRPKARAGAVKGDSTAGGEERAG